MNIMEKLNDFMLEINRGWITGYARIQDGELRVFNDNHELVLVVDEKIDIEIHDENYEEYVDQITYMIER